MVSTTISSIYPARYAICAQNLFDGDVLRGPAQIEILSDRIVALHGPDVVIPDIPVVTLPPDAVLAPGFVDLQVNGGGDVLLNHAPTAETVARIAEAHLAFGTTTLLPTLITDAPERIRSLLDQAETALGVPGVAGFHLEGPFLNRGRKGIHPAQHIRTMTDADMDLLCRFGRLGASLVTLAPETVPPGAIRTLVEAGLRVAIGHSEAGPVDVAAAEADGATLVTHLFNAMSQMTGRSPGVVGAALSSDNLRAGIICDGLHVDSANVRAAWRAMGPKRLFLVSDAMATVGGSRSGFTLHGREITLKEGCLVDAEGTLAGAHMTMLDSVLTAVRLARIPLADALMMATSTPADAIGLGDRAGRLQAGRRADLVALDDTGLVAVWSGGQSGGASRPDAARSPDGRVDRPASSA
jgi:N-acetylglucosamine-6-phosphate deacetylase